jgi:hypothetical protein
MLQFLYYVQWDFFPRSILASRLSLVNDKKILTMLEAESVKKSSNT